MICSVTILASTNSEPYVAVSTVACHLEYKSVGVVFMKCNTAVTDFPVTKSCSKLPFKKVMHITPISSSLGISSGISSLTLP